MQEVWKDIEEFEGSYQISNLGRVKSLERIIDKHNYGKILKSESILKVYDKNVYLQVSLCKNGKYTYKNIHRLVAEAFILNPNNLPCVNHKDGNKHNNRVDNLEWCSKSYNLKEAYRLGLKKAPVPGLGKFGKASKISKEILQIDKVGNIVNHFYGCYEAERMTGIDKSNINSCCKNKCKTAGGYYWKYKNEYLGY